MAKELKSKLAELVIEKGGKVTKINWKKIDALHREDSDLARQWSSEALEHLVDKKILCYPRKGDHFPTGIGIDLSPRGPCSELYHFVSEKGAKDYIEQTLNNAAYGVRIAKT